MEASSLLLVSTSVLGLGGVALTWKVIGQPLWDKVKPLWAFSDVVQGKNIEKHTKDAPKPLKTLEAGLKKALKEFEKNKEKGLETATHTLATFLTHPERKTIFQHDNATKTNHLFIRLENFFIQLQSQKIPITKAQLHSLHQFVETIVKSMQGELAKIQSVFKKIIPRIKNAAADHIRHVGSMPDESALHPLLKIRSLENKEEEPSKSPLIHHYLGQLEFKDANLDTLNQQMIHRMIDVKNEDPKGYEKMARQLGLDANLPFSSYSSHHRDKLYVAYQQMRKEKPLLPRLSNKLEWKQPTSYEQEKRKGFDLTACLAIFAVFKVRYGADTLTKRNFYQTLSKTHDMAPQKRMETIMNFLKDERARFQTAWIPWALDQYFFKSLYSIVKTLSSKCVASSPFFENMQVELRETPIPAMVFLGEKVSRYFHYLENKYNEWCKDYPYDLTMDTFLRNKLYKRQELSLGNLNLDFFLGRYNFMQSLHHLNHVLYKWACSPTFQKNQFFSLLNPMLVIIKQVMFTSVRVLLQLLKLPVIFAQWVMNRVLMTLMEQLLIHTSLFETVDEVITEALLDPTPYQFPLLEVALENLREILEIIEQNSQSPTQNHADNYRAKRALKEAVRTFVRFAKSLDSFNTDSKPTDQILFETVLPPAIDKFFEVILKIHATYSQKDHLEKQATDFLQALNFYVYNKHQPTEVDEDLIKRHQMVKEHIAIYTKKIAHALIVQTSSEELSEDLGNAVKKFLSNSQDLELPKLTQNYINRNKSLLIEVIKKSYIMKGLFVHLITQEREA